MEARNDKLPVHTNRPCFWLTQSRIETENQKDNRFVHTNSPSFSCTQNRRSIWNVPHNTFIRTWRVDQALQHVVLKAYDSQFRSNYMDTDPAHSAMLLAPLLQNALNIWI